MIQVLDLRAAIGRLVVVAAILSLFIYYSIVWLAIPNWPTYKIITVISLVAPTLVTLSASNMIWRPLWKHVVTRWDTSAYPDLNGVWDGKIQPSPDEHGTALGALPIKVRIRQSMFKIFIDFHGESFTSITLAATPRIDQGQHHLYYIYRSESHDSERPPYLGTTTLRIQATGPRGNRRLSLSGPYYTARKTKGTIHLAQVSPDPDHDFPSS